MINLVSLLFLNSCFFFFFFGGGYQKPIFWPEMVKKGNGWFSSVKKVFRPSSKDLPEKKVRCFYYYYYFLRKGKGKLIIYYQWNNVLTIICYENSIVKTDQNISKYIIQTWWSCNYFFQKNLLFYLVNIYFRIILHLTYKLQNSSISESRFDILQKSGSKSLHLANFVISLIF